MAAVQGLLKKHDAFETDFAAHRDRCADICNAGAQLTAANNHHADSIAQRCHQLQVIIQLISRGVRSHIFHIQIKIHND